ncbi:MAG: hypothetical protein AABX47_00785 [Nanoarchaeota archaeon]
MASGPRSARIKFRFGQTSILLIVVAIILIASILSIRSLKPNVTETQLPTGEDLLSIKPNIEYCLGSTLEDAIMMVGYIGMRYPASPDSRSILGVPVDFIVLNGTFAFPTRLEAIDGITRYTKDNLPLCVNKILSPESHLRIDISSIEVTPTKTTIAVVASTRVTDLKRQRSESFESTSSIRFDLEAAYNTTAQIAYAINRSYPLYPYGEVSSVAMAHNLSIEILEPSPATTLISIRHPQEVASRAYYSLLMIDR